MAVHCTAQSSNHLYPGAIISIANAPTGMYVGGRRKQEKLPKNLQDYGKNMQNPTRTPSQRHDRTVDAGALNRQCYALIAYCSFNIDS